MQVEPIEIAKMVKNKNIDKKSQFSVHKQLCHEYNFL